MDDRASGASQIPGERMVDPRMDADDAGMLLDLTWLLSRLTWFDKDGRFLLDKDG